MFLRYLSKTCFALCLLATLAACSAPSSNETKAAPEKTASDVQQAPPAAAPAAAPVPVAPAEPAEKPHNIPKKTAAVANVQPPVAAPQAAPPPPPAPEPAPAQAPVPVAPPPPPPPPPIAVIDTKDVTIPAGTAVTISMIDSVDSSTGHVGDTFRATIDMPVTIDNDVVIQKGANAVVKLTDVTSAGRVKGKSEIHLVLDRVTIGKNTYTVNTNAFEESGSDQGKKAVRNGAIGAALGAAIGAIAGGGKGAAIGAGAGGGGGVGATAVMNGDQVRVPSETKVMFTLTDPVKVTITPGMPAAIPRATAVAPRDRFSTSPQQQDGPPPVRRRQQYP
jgi:hypothetical protein